MCLAVPMRVREIHGGSAVLESDGFSCVADVSLLGRLDPGDYAIVHAGFAIERLDSEEADRRIALFRELAALAGKKMGELR